VHASSSIVMAAVARLTSRDALLTSSSGPVGSYATGEHIAPNGPVNGVNGHSRRAQFDGLHEEDEEDEATAADESQATAELANLRHGFDYAESVLAEEEQLRTSTWLPWTDVRLASRARDHARCQSSATASKRSPVPASP
jgi:hypothetical protein